MNIVITNILLVSLVVPSIYYDIIHRLNLCYFILVNIFSSSSNLPTLIYLCSSSLTISCILYNITGTAISPISTLTKYL